MNVEELVEWARIMGVPEDRARRAHEAREAFKAADFLDALNREREAVLSRAERAEGYVLQLSARLGELEEEVATFFTATGMRPGQYVNNKWSPPGAVKKATVEAIERAERAEARVRELERAQRGSAFGL